MNNLLSSEGISLNAHWILNVSSLLDRSSINIDTSPSYPTGCDSRAKPGCVIHWLVGYFFYARVDNISVTYVTAHRCAGGLTSFCIVFSANCLCINRARSGLYGNIENSRAHNVKARGARCDFLGGPK